MTIINNIKVEKNILNQQAAVEPKNTTETPILQYGNANAATNVSNSTNTINSPKDAVEFASKELGIDANTPEYEQLKRDVTLKYNTMQRVAEAKGETLDPSVVQVRINNYVKGWAFNQFEQQALMSENPKRWEYTVSSDITDEQAFALLKENYSNLADGYIEFYDGDGNGSIDIIEMFNQELIEHYKNQGLSDSEAKSKAIGVAQKFNNMSFAEIAQSTDDSDEMQLYQLLQIKFGTMEEASSKPMTLSGIRTLDKDEVQAFLFTKAQFDETGSNTITPQESGAFELDILQGGSKSMSWLKAAREFLGL